MNRLIPLNLLLFADGGEDEGVAKQETAEKPDNKEPSRPPIHPPLHAPQTQNPPRRLLLRNGFMMLLPARS